MACVVVSHVFMTAHFPPSVSSACPPAVFFLFLMYTQLHDTVQYFMEFLNDFRRRGWLGCVYSYIYIYAHIRECMCVCVCEILLYEVSLNATTPSVTHIPTRFSEKRKYSGNSYTFYIISDKG